MPLASQTSVKALEELSSLAQDPHTHSATWWVEAAQALDCVLEDFTIEVAQDRSFFKEQITHYPHIANAVKQLTLKGDTAVNAIRSCRRELTMHAGDHTYLQATGTHLAHIHNAISQYQSLGRSILHSTLRDLGVGD